MTLKDELTPHLKQLHRTGTMNLPQELYNRVRDEYERRNGRKLPPCSTCLQDFIKQICNE